MVSRNKHNHRIVTTNTVVGIVMYACKRLLGIFRIVYIHVKVFRTKSRTSKEKNLKNNNKI